MIFCHSAAGSGESCHDRFLTFRFDETFGISLDNGPMRITGSSMTTIAPITNCTEGVDKHAISAEQHTAAIALCSLCICSMMALIASSYPDEKTRAACRKRKHENRAQLALSWTPPPPTLTDPQGMPTPGLNGAPNARSLSTQKPQLSASPLTPPHTHSPAFTAVHRLSRAHASSSQPHAPSGGVRHGSSRPRRWGRPVCQEDSTLDSLTQCAHAACAPFGEEQVAPRT